jgi:hypothetical protein
MPLVRTVFQPTVQIEVSDAEAASLHGQGLLVDPEHAQMTGVAENPADGLVITPAPPDMPTAPDTEALTNPDGADTKKGNKA